MRTGDRPGWEVEEVFLRSDEKQLAVEWGFILLATCLIVAGGILTSYLCRSDTGRTVLYFTAT